MELSKVIEQLNRRISEQNLPEHFIVTDQADDCLMAHAFFELIKALPDADEAPPSTEDMSMFKALNEHLYYRLDSTILHPDVAQWWVRANELADDKFASHYKLINPRSLSSDDMVNFWIKCAQGKGEETYSYLLEIYQWLRDERDEEWAEEFREEYEIDEEDW